MFKDSKYVRDLRARDFRSSGATVNDCFRPSRDASKADLQEYHREEMGLRKARRRQPQHTSLTAWLERNPNWDHRNYSRRPKGEKRTSQPVYS